MASAVLLYTWGVAALFVNRKRGVVGFVKGVVGFSNQVEGKVQKINNFLISRNGFIYIYIYI